MANSRIDDVLHAARELQVEEPAPAPKRDEPHRKPVAGPVVWIVVALVVIAAVVAILAMR